MSAGLDEAPVERMDSVQVVGRALLHVLRGDVREALPLFGLQFRLALVRWWIGEHGLVHDFYGPCETEEQRRATEMRLAYGDGPYADELLAEVVGIARQLLGNNPTMDGVPELLSVDLERVSVLNRPNGWGVWVAVTGNSSYITAIGDDQDRKYFPFS